jgi:hypothetical protein
LGFAAEVKPKAGLGFRASAAFSRHTATPAILFPMKNRSKPDDLPSDVLEALYSEPMSTLGIPNLFQLLSNEPKLMVLHV